MTTQTQNRAYWKMNDGGGQLIKDFGVNGLNATLGSNGAGTDGNDPIWRPQYAVCSNIARKGIAIEENDAINSEAISLFPNPATSTVHIRSNNGANLESVRMMDIQGRQVADFGSVESIDISTFATGLYYLELTVNGNIERKKLQIVK